MGVDRAVHAGHPTNRAFPDNLPADGGQCDPKSLLNWLPVAPAAKEASIHSAGQGVCFYADPQGGIFAMINPFLVPAARKPDARRPLGWGDRHPIDQDDG
jgi:hypothetical protein